jgi:nucleoside-diphosphate-sugar epimerase
MKKAIVTGGAGFIGSNLVDKLIGMGIQVSVIDNFSTGKIENTNKKAHYWKQDLSTVELDELTEFMKGVDVIFHTAAKARVQPSIDDPITYNNHNVNATLNILYAAHKAGVKRVVYSASSSAYGDTTELPTPETTLTNPMSPYGLQKYIGEQYCRVFSEVYGLDTVSLRYFSVYGNRMLLEGAYCLVLGIFAKQMLEGKPLTITNNGKQRRDFTHVDDIVEANILAATREENFKGDVFNIGNGKNYSVNEVADMFGGKKSYGEKRIEPFETLADNSKVKLKLNWEPKGDLEKWIIKYKKELGI